MNRVPAYMILISNTVIVNVINFKRFAHIFDTAIQFTYICHFLPWCDARDGNVFYPLASQFGHCQRNVISDFCDRVLITAL